MAYGRTGLRLETARSPDAGSSWSAPVVAARIPPRGVGVLQAGRPSVRAIPVSGTGPAVTPGSGAVYEAFVSGGGTSVSLVRSVNGGRSWSRPRVVVRHRRGVFGPALAAGEDGLALTFYTRERGGRARFRMALRPGWRSPALGAPFALGRAPRAGRSVFLGDYSGLAATPGGGFAAAFAVAPPLAAGGGASDVLVSLFKTRLSTP